MFLSIGFAAVAARKRHEEHRKTLFCFQRAAKNNVAFRFLSSSRHLQWKRGNLGSFFIANDSKESKWGT
jgi:hypothetical protein